MYLVLSTFMTYAERERGERREGGVGEERGACCMRVYERGGKGSKRKGGFVREEEGGRKGDRGTFDNW